MSNICVISKESDFAALLGQHPLLGRDVEIAELPPSQTSLPDGSTIVLLMLEADDAENWLRQYNQNVPVIILISKKSEARFQLLCERWTAEKEVFLHILTFPIQLSLLYQAITRHKSRDDNANKPIESTGQWQLDAKKNILRCKEKEFVLTDKEIQLLQALLKYHPTPVTKDRLLEEVWQYGKGVDTHTLETHIYRLRQKVGHELPLVMTTEEGYVLVGF